MGKLLHQVLFGDGGDIRAFYGGIEFEAKKTKNRDE